MRYRLPLMICLIVLSLLLSIDAVGQRRSAPSVGRPAATNANDRNKTVEVGQTAVVIDELLSPLRMKPSLYAPVIHRMQRGRRVQILGTEEADGVKFFRVSVPPSNFGYVQADAVFGPFRPGDDKRLAQLVLAATGFDQIEMAMEFFKMYPDTQYRPPILLRTGDLLEDVAATLTRNANNRLRRGEMAATGAPIHSYYLNFVGIDRYRKLGINFLFSTRNRSLHYDGTLWRELVKKYPGTEEAAQAQQRLDSLTEKLSKTP